MSTTNQQIINKGSTTPNSGDSVADFTIDNQWPTDKPWQPTIINKETPTPKPLRPLTRRQAAFVKHLVDNPKASATAAVRATYNVTDMTKSTARTIAAENLAKPNIRLELAKHSATAENTLLEIMNYSKEYGRKNSGAREQGAAYASIAVSAAKDILDRVHGKATQRTESTSQAVTLNIDLSGAVSPDE